MQEGCRILLVLFALFAVSTACYWRKCPIGGKRTSSFRPLRQCPKCGPFEGGQCVGPLICCGESFGCHIATADTLVCSEESRLSTPCTGPELQPSCRAVEGGSCATSYICCNEDICAIDYSCEESETGMVRRTNSHLVNI
ncbi:oxytocin-neurophysin 1-like [Anneissia japonica]|uniref:oxytocin-neurophysin 1-like n=1 Tax=Anneissia japonica TaxID=1529436 RepID=UPI0014256604|nr:oxytocin-neurophysin 1-like [Anneissia japonica]